MQFRALTNGVNIVDIANGNSICSYSEDAGDTWSAGINHTFGSNKATDVITINATHEHSSVGGSQSHNNMPPYLTVYIWKRTG